MKRLWNKINKTGNCWEWTGGKSRGYGLFWHDGKLQPAHRVVYELLTGSGSTIYLLNDQAAQLLYAVCAYL